MEGVERGWNKPNCGWGMGTLKKLEFPAHHRGKKGKNVTMGVDTAE